MKILFMGRKKVAAAALEHLASMPGIDVVGVLTDDHLKVSPTAATARRLGVPLLDFAQACADARSGRLRYDLGVSMLYWRKLGADLLDAASRGAINFHPAPLPRYKGTGGYNLAILEGLDRWAVSAHYMDAGIDTGPLVEVRWFPIDPQHETVVTLERRSMIELQGLFVDTMRAALAAPGRLPASPNVGGEYLSRAAMEALKRVQPGDDVARKVRAFWFPPYDGAWVEIDGRRYTLVSSDILQTLGDPESSSLFTRGSGA